MSCARLSQRTSVATAKNVEDSPMCGMIFSGDYPTNHKWYKWLVTGVNPLIHRIIYENGELRSRVIDHLQAVGWPSKYLGWICGSGFRRIHCTKIKYAQKPGVTAQVYPGSCNTTHIPVAGKHWDYGHPELPSPLPPLASRWAQKNHRNGKHRKWNHQRFFPRSCPFNCPFAS